jgi:GWxTD domain-containing protein
MSATGMYGQNNDAIINIYSELLTQSLVSYTEDTLREGQKKVSFRILYEIYSQSDSSDSWQSTEKKTVLFSEGSQDTDHQKINMAHTFNVPGPGKYRAVVIVQDSKSRKAAKAETEVVIPRKLPNTFGISGITFTALDSAQLEQGYKPVTTYEVTRDFEALRFECQVTDGMLNDSLSIDVIVKRFRSDVEPALRLSASAFRVGVVEREGIVYNDYETVYSQHRTIQPGEKIFTYKVGMDTPSIGNYRFEITIYNGNGESFTRAFDFGIKRAGFPFVETPRQFAQPLYYLMDKKDYEKLMSIKNSDSLKRAVDEFWISNLHDLSVTRRVISLYYSYVEDANKYFSNYKEGWKTDMGMIYILMGPPMHSRNFSKSIRWAYSTDEYDPRTTFVFKQERIKSGVFPFDVYLLDRRGILAVDNEYYIINEWLNGDILR